MRPRPSATGPSRGPAAGGEGERERLPDAELFECIRRDGDPRARELLIERYLPLAHQLARRYQRADEPQEDLVQVASLGLIKAVDRFDTKHEVVFSTSPSRHSRRDKRYFRPHMGGALPRDLQELALPRRPDGRPPVCANPARPR
jgi:RNA polymerase sigma-B factor